MTTAKPTAPDVAARRARVAAMRARHMTTRAIAAELGVGETTVRRDLAAIDAERAAATPPPAPPRAAESRHPAPPRRRLELDIDDALADALRTLVAAVPGARHTPATYRTAARAAIRATADSIMEAQAAIAADGAPSGRAAAPPARQTAPVAP
ncbi:DeoR family transcriptional regulator [Streptomyces nodosus]|uniref:DeoR family transcriptional regulator n=1 Tax=Streptomyces nodosus TaxID=40318 RepID=UPI0036E185DD